MLAGEEFNTRRVVNSGIVKSRKNPSINKKQNRK